MCLKGIKCSKILTLQAQYPNSFAAVSQYGYEQQTSVCKMGEAIAFLYKSSARLYVCNVKFLP